MTKRLISSYNGIQEYLHEPDRDGDLVIETYQDVEPILERAKQLSEQTPGVEWRHVGLIPNFFLDKAAKEGWINDKKKWHAWLNDPDNKAFRTWPGRIGPTHQV